MRKRLLALLTALGCAVTSTAFARVPTPTPTPKPTPKPTTTENTHKWDPLHNASHSLWDFEYHNKWEKTPAPTPTFPADRKDYKKVSYPDAVRYFSSYEDTFVQMTGYVYEFWFDEDDPTTAWWWMSSKKNGDGNYALVCYKRFTKLNWHGANVDQFVYNDKTTVYGRLIDTKDYDTTEGQTFTAPVMDAHLLTYWHD